MMWQSCLRAVLHWFDSWRPSVCEACDCGAAQEKPHTMKSFAAYADWVKSVHFCEPPPQAKVRATQLPALSWRGRPLRSDSLAHDDAGAPVLSALMA